MAVSTALVTVTGILLESDPSVAVTVALPEATAVRFPAALTVTTLALEVV
jgi:hypothetical protein